MNGNHCGRPAPAAGTIDGRRECEAVSLRVLSRSCCLVRCRRRRRIETRSSTWDTNGNGDLTCGEALGEGGADGLKLPAYEDDRDGTGLIYEWLERGTSSDTDNDGISC